MHAHLLHIAATHDDAMSDVAANDDAPLRLSLVAAPPRADARAPKHESDDDYQLGGYAGI